MIIENILKAKKEFKKSLKDSFESGLKEVIDPNSMQAIVVYKIPFLEKIEMEKSCDCKTDNPKAFISNGEYQYIFGFRPLKEKKDLLHLAEQFKKDRDLEYACIPLDGSDYSSFSTTKVYPKTKDVKKLVDKYKKILEYLEFVFEELGDDLDLKVSCDENLQANIFKLT